MSEDLKQHLSEQSTWRRGIFMLIMVVFYSLAEIVIGAIVIFQFLTRLLTGKINPKLLEFSAGLNRYIYQILQFWTYRSEEKPFPFADWPQDADIDAPSSATSTTKPRGKKSQSVARKKGDETPPAE